MRTGQADGALLPREPTMSRRPALTIQCDAGIGVSKLVGSHTGVVPIVLLRDVEESQSGDATFVLYPHSVQPSG